MGVKFYPPPKDYTDLDVLPVGRIVPVNRIIDWYATDNTDVMDFVGDVNKINDTQFNIEVGTISNSETSVDAGFTVRMWSSVSSQKIMSNSYLRDIFEYGFYMKT